MERDTLCGAGVDENKSKMTFDFQGKIYYFCSSECRDKFAEATMSGITPKLLRQKEKMA